MSVRLLLDPQGGEGTTAPEKPDLTKQAQNLAEKHGSADAALVLMLTEAKAYREEIKALKGKQPAEGAVVLTGDDAARWRSYQELGTPENLRKIVREHGEVSKENATLKRTTHLDEIADLAGMKRSVLRQVAGDTQFTVKDETRRDAATGKDEPFKAVYVTGEDGKETPIEKHAEAHWTDFLPALRPETGEKARPIGTPPREFPPTTDPAERRRVADPAMAERAASGLYARMK